MKKSSDIVTMGVGVRAITLEHTCLWSLLCCRPFCDFLAEVVDALQECSGAAGSKNIPMSV